MVEDEKNKKKRNRDDTVDDDDNNTSESRKARKKKKKHHEEASLPVNSTEEKGKRSLQASPAPSPKDVSEFLIKHAITIDTPPGIKNPTPMISFAQLDIPDQLRTAFTGFKEPTPIQACTWPSALKGYDVVGIAETGR